MYPVLNLPKADIRIKTENGKSKVFDIIRQKLYILNPEEWVRQHWIHALITHSSYPQGLFEIESSINLDGMRKRFDIIVRKKDLGIHILIECKAPEVPIDSDTLLQASKYARILKPDYIFLSNGIQHYMFKNEEGNLSIIHKIPDY